MTNIKIAHGRACEELTHYMRQNKIDRVLVVANEHYWVPSGIDVQLKEQLHNLKILLFHQFTSNPCFDEVMAACKLMTTCKAQMILGLGGGTAMDIAKSVAVLANYSEQDARNAIENSASTFTNKVCPLVLIPTTAGSGSEATHFAVMYLDDKKYSLASPAISSELSIVDGTLTYSTPQPVAASCGIDAMCQAVESYWAVAATKESQIFAVAAIKLLNQYLVTAVLEKSHEACNKVAEAACLAGQAIDISKTTAAHAFSYYFTSVHDTPHGHAVSLCFPATARCNYDSKNSLLPPGELDSRFKDLFNLIGVAGIEEFIHWFQNLVRLIGLEQDVEKLGFKPDEELEVFLSSVNMERLKNNPAEIDIEQFKKLFLQR